MFNLQELQFFHERGNSKTSPLCHLSTPHLPLLVKPQDVVAHTAGPATLHLMLVSEKFLAGKAPAIVQLTMCQHSQQSAFTSIHIPHHCNPERHKSTKM